MEKRIAFDEESPAWEFAQYAKEKQSDWIIVDYIEAMPNENGRVIASLIHSSGSQGAVLRITDDVMGESGKVYWDFLVRTISDFWKGKDE